jgi:iron complex transport system substrate-binding protein
MLNRSVTLAQKPSRIVCISPTATETLYEVGGSAVGRDTASTYPPEAQSLPTVGSTFSPSIESIGALNPDLVIIEALSQAQLVSSLGALGVPVIAMRATSLDDVEQGLRLIGQVVDANEGASQAITSIEGRIDAAKKTLSISHNALILIADANRNIYAAKPESYPGALLALLGQSNLAKGMPDSGPYPGFASFTGEQALSANADAIFAISPAPAPAPSLSSMLPQIPGFSSMAIVKNGQVKELDPVLFLEAPGPRIADAVEQLAAYLKATAP